MSITLASIPTTAMLGTLSEPQLPGKDIRWHGDHGVCPTGPLQRLAPNQLELNAANSHFELAGLNPQPLPPTGGAHERACELKNILVSG